MQASYIFLIILLVAALGVCSIVFPEGVGAIVILTLMTALTLPVLLRNSNDSGFIYKLFLAGLLIRILFGSFIYVLELQDFFGPDAITYDARGSLIADYWHGQEQFSDPYLDIAMSTSGAGWGMHYLVAAIYYIGGRNPLAAMAFCWVFGAAIGPVVYICCQRIFNNSQVARFAAFMTAFFPAFVIWSSQLVKDGLIIFLLVVVMITVIRLQEKFSYGALIALILGMFGILSLRFYIFYMLAIAVVGSFVIGLSNSPASVFRRTAVLIILGIGLTYLGVIRNASVNFEKYGTLERLQRSRSDQAIRGESGFGEDIDVSTTEGALTAVPVGLAYLMLAPFPWQIGNLRQAVALPETLLWWAMIPLMIAGIIYTVRHRLREAFPILLFSLMLTLAYSIFQGNVGTAYRQRTQIQVFLFMFIAVGWVLRKEMKENRQIEARARQQSLPTTHGST